MKKANIMNRIALTSLFGVIASITLSQAHAAEIMPDFSTAPAGWLVDRAAPASFANIGTYQGADNVLGIGVNAAPQTTGNFYNTQGMSHPMAGGVGDILSAALYVQPGWSTPSAGYVRTDMWGVMTNAGGSTVTGYPIIGFTNNGTNGFVGFRAWDDLNGNWANLTAQVNYDAWNTLALEWDGSRYDYFVNGVAAASFAGDPTTTALSSVIMQAYNFDNPALYGTGPIPDAAKVGYQVHWAASKIIPEPTSLALLGVGLVALGALRRRRADRHSA